MAKEWIGLICLVAFIFAIYSGVKVGHVMALIAITGLLLITGFKSTVSITAMMPYNAVGNSSYAAMAMFMLVGEVIYRAGFGEDMFIAAERWLGRLSGGLAIATASASAVMGFITSSNIANITMGKIAIPEMKKANYDTSLAAGAVAGGASMASVVPPSAGFILYAMLTGESLAALYIAAAIPAVLLFVIMVGGIWVRCKAAPEKAPKGQKYTWKEKIVSLKLIWPIALVIILSLVGIYRGFMTPMEAASVTAFVCIVLAFLARRINLVVLKDILAELAEMLGMTSLLVTNAFIFQRLITLSGLPALITRYISAANLSPAVVILLIMALYIVFGMVSEINACLMVTIPIFYTIIVRLGFDPIWFGVLVVSLTELGSITPPFGMNVFTLSGISGIPATTIFKGTWVYSASLLFLAILLLLFPGMTSIL